MAKDIIDTPRKFIPTETADLGHSRWNIVLVGAGGTGSHSVPHLARMMALPGLLSKRIASLTIVDHDRVESDNVGRQLFIQPDIGRFKAQVLAERYSKAYGVSIAFFNQKVIRGMIRPDGLIPTGSFRRPTLILGAVDNPRGRRAIYAAVKQHHGPRKALYWFDAGNGFDRGQVAWGNTVNFKKIQGELGRPLVEYVPYPPALFPNLIQDAPRPGLSCAQAIRAGEQGLHINAQMAVVLAEMIRKFLLGQLDVHYSVIDFHKMRMISQPLTTRWLEAFVPPA